MNEKPSFVPETEKANNKESRFGDKEEILKILAEGEAKVLGSIDDVNSRTTAPHKNVVERVNINSVEMVEIEYKDKTIECIFKPFEGENEQAKKDDHLELKKLYPQEVLAYEISEHFNFDIVPPTVVRSINGKIGALQYFVNPEEYVSYEVLQDEISDDEDQDYWQKISSHEDMQKMILLDFILLNCDRNNGNFLTRVENHEGQDMKPGEINQDDPALVAIDHGVCLSLHDYIRFDKKIGPVATYTRGKEIPIPEKLIDMLRDGYKKMGELRLSDYLEDVHDPKEFIWMWQRVDALIKKGIFLSKLNIYSLPEEVMKGEDFPHPHF